MTLKEIFEQLTFGELSQLNLGGAELGEIDGNNYVRIIPHINLAMTALYKRFNLKEDRVRLYPITFKYLYDVHPKHSTPNIFEVTDSKYLIKPNGLPVTNNILKIERVTNDLDIDFNLNDINDNLSLYTPTMTSIRFPMDIINKTNNLPKEYLTEYFEIIYRAKHDVIGENIDFLAIETIEIDLPEAYLELLLLFIAARIMTPMGAGQFEGLGGNNYMAKYEMKAQEIEQTGLKIDHNSRNTRLYEKGWA